MKFEVETREDTIALDLDEDKQVANIHEEAYPFTFWKQQNGRFLLRINQKLYKVDNVEVEEENVSFTINGQWMRLTVRDEQDLLLDRLGFKKPGMAGGGQLKAPMPGKILDIMVSEGDMVEMDQPVAILEAMKMENELTAPQAGRIKNIQAAKGNSVDKNAIILEIEASG